MPAPRPHYWWLKRERVRKWHLVLLVLVVALFIVHIISTTSQLSSMMAELEETRESLRVLQTELSEKERQLQFTQTDEYVEQQARERFGYIKPGEIRFVPENMEETK